MDKIREEFEKAFNLTEEYCINTVEEKAFILGHKSRDGEIKKLSDALTTIEHMCFSSKKWPEHMHQAVLKDISTTATEALKDGK